MESVASIWALQFVASFVKGALIAEKTMEALESLGMGCCMHTNNGIRNVCIK